MYKPLSRRAILSFPSILSRTRKLLFSPILIDPEAFKELWIQVKQFIQTCLERDIPQLVIHVSSVNLRRFWSILAHMHGQLWNASQIARALGVSAPTARHYLDILQETFVVRQLTPYHPKYI